MKLRTLLFWPHLIAGVLTGAVILVMSVTGVVLTYERQLNEWSNGDYQTFRNRQPDRQSVRSNWRRGRET